MRIAYFDTIAGISGDMTLAAFISAGLPLEKLSGEITKLGLHGVELSASRIIRNGITAVKVDVIISAPERRHRHLKDVFKIVDDSALAGTVKEKSKQIFLEVAKAEAKVHDVPIEKVHFHEVGALDSIVDIVGAAICLDELKIEQAYSSPVKLGSGGFVEADHGKLPLPGPAVTEILRGYPTILTDIPYELTTPTGAAIIKAMSAGVMPNERIRIDSVGYGSGTRDMKEIPNLLRIIIGEIDQDSSGEELMMVETNIDDMNPEIYPYLIERLFQLGANDAWLTSVIMKKGRPGVIVSVLTSREKLTEINRLLLTETTTLGTRSCAVQRKISRREIVEQNTSFGRLKVKRIEYEGREIFAPEFEECKRVASRLQMPLIDVYRKLESELR